jgi:hypothetical protein
VSSRRRTGTHHVHGRAHTANTGGGILLPAPQSVTRRHSSTVSHHGQPRPWQWLGFPVIATPETCAAWKVTAPCARCRGAGRARVATQASTHTITCTVYNSTHRGGETATTGMLWRQWQARRGRRTRRKASTAAETSLRHSLIHPQHHCLPNAGHTASAGASSAAWSNDDSSVRMERAERAQGEVTLRGAGSKNHYTDPLAQFNMVRVWARVSAKASPTRTTGTDKNNVMLRRSRQGGARNAAGGQDQATRAPTTLMKPHPRNSRTRTPQPRPPWRARTTRTNECNDNHGEGDSVLQRYEHDPTKPTAQEGVGKEYRKGRQSSGAASSVMLASECDGSGSTIRCTSHRSLA